MLHLQLMEQSKEKKMHGSGTTTSIISNEEMNHIMKIFRALEDSGKGTVRAGEGMLRAGYGSSIKKKALILPHPLTNFEIKEYYENEPRFNGTYSRGNLPKKK